METFVRSQAPLKIHAFGHRIGHSGIPIPITNDIGAIFESLLNLLNLFPAIGTKEQMHSLITHLLLAIQKLVNHSADRGAAVREVHGHRGFFPRQHLLYILRNGALA